jgi:hypothetical protein
MPIETLKLDPASSGRVAVRREDHELIAPHACAVIAVANAFANHRRERADNRIPVRVAARVVNSLQVVDIHEQRGIARRTPRQRPANGIQRTAPVEQPREAVADRRVVVLFDPVIQVEMVERDDVADQQRDDERGNETPGADLLKPRLLRQVILQIEVDADETDVTTLAVVDCLVCGEKIAVIVLLKSRRHPGGPGGDLHQPVALVFLANLKPLHIRGGAQVPADMKVG